MSINSIATYPTSECRRAGVQVDAFDVFEFIGAGVSGGVGTSSSGPDTSGRDFTKSFKKSKRLSDRIHCFLEVNINV